MKYLLILTVGVCLLFASVPATPDQAQDEAAIRQAMEQRLVAFNNHDVDALVELTDEVFEYWNGSVKGKEALRNDLSESFKSSKDVKRKSLGEIGIVFVTPDVAIFKGRRESSGWVDESGKPYPPFKEMLARVFVRRNGKWLLAASFLSELEE